MQWVTPSWGSRAVICAGSARKDQLREAILRRRERSEISSYGIPARAMEAFAPVVAELAGR